MPPVKLIATDVDGTLLRSDRTVSPRTIATLHAAVDAGVHVGLVSGRQINGLRHVAEQIELHEVVVGSNGSVGFDLANDTLIFEDPLDVASQHRLVDAVTDALPGALFAAVRDSGRTLVAGPGYVDLMSWTDHYRTPYEVQVMSLAELADVPAIKMVIRHADLSVDDVFRHVSALRIPGINPTTSGAPSSRSQTRRCRRPAAWPACARISESRLPRWQLSATSATTWPCSPGQGWASPWATPCPK